MSGIRTILFPTDFSDCSRQAFDLACTMAREHDARLLVLHVQNGPGPLVVDREVFTRLRPVEHQEWLWKVLRQLRMPPGEGQVEHLLVEGEPARQILSIAASRGCDLIVMGTHGRSGLERLLLGSVSEQVLRKARCPVIMVKLPRHASDFSSKDSKATAKFPAAT
jgi:nucleotide-binding universal stress UspA family protein